MKKLTDKEVKILEDVLSRDGLKPTFEASDVYAVYVVFPTRKVGFSDFENALTFCAGYHEAKLEM